MPPLVYVVDDDDGARDSLSALIQSLGYQAESFRTGEEFLEQYNPGSAVALVLDLRLPGQSGLEVQAALKSAGDDLPVVFVSGHADHQNQAQALRQGATAVLAKPFSQELFQRTLKQIVDPTAGGNDTPNEPV